jgi:tRNA nucleotidyltransferase (CCA-adding enzyme)
MLKTSLKVLNKLEENGYHAYIIGGFVRDYILGIESKDVDIATNATPKEIMEIFENSALPKEEYGAVTLYVKNNRFEITTFRKEIRYLNNRKPIEIKYIDDLMEDLERRDFKMNTLCMDKEGKVIDLLNGTEDIENKIINTVGDSNHKFEEDSLRILRAIRFATILNFKLSDEVKKAIINNKESLRKLSYNRKRQELDKIFSSKNSKYGVELLLELQLDQELELYNLKDIKLNGDILGIWASLIIGDGYQFTSNEKTIIKNIKEVISTSISEVSLYKYGLYVNQVAADIIGIDRTLITRLYESLPITSRKSIEISSQDIMNILNKKAGPYFKEIYQDLEVKILKGELENNKEIIENYIIQNYS